MLPAERRNAAITRLGGLAPLDNSERAALRDAEQHSIVTPARMAVIEPKTASVQSLIVLNGWACRLRDLRDGRRQIVDLVLPGELIEVNSHSAIRNGLSVVALTNVTTVQAPYAEPGSALASAYAISAAHAEDAMVRQIIRLGRLDALGRVADLLVDLQDRLVMSESATAGSFTLPLTQEMLSDVLGLTSVHVNRTLKALRVSGLLRFDGKMVTFRNRDELLRAARLG